MYRLCDARIEKPLKSPGETFKTSSQRFRLLERSSFFVHFSIRTADRRRPSAIMCTTQEAFVCAVSLRAPHAWDTPPHVSTIFVHLVIVLVCLGAALILTACGRRLQCPVDGTDRS